MPKPSFTVNGRKRELGLVQDVLKCMERNFYHVKLPPGTLLGAATRTTKRQCALTENQRVRAIALRRIFDGIHAGFCTDEDAVHGFETAVSGEQFIMEFEIEAEALAEVLLWHQNGCKDPTPPVPRVPPSEGISPELADIVSQSSVGFRKAVWLKISSVHCGLGVNGLESVASKEEDPEWRAIWPRIIQAYKRSQAHRATEMAMAIIEASAALGLQRQCAECGHCADSQVLLRCSRCRNANALYCGIVPKAQWPIRKQSCMPVGSRRAKGIQSSTAES